MISATWRKSRTIGGNTRPCPKLKVTSWSLAKKRLFKTNLNFAFGSSVGVHVAYRAYKQGRLVYGDCRTAAPPNNFVFYVIGIATKHWIYFYFCIQFLLKSLCDCLTWWTNGMLCFRNAKETIFVSRVEYTFVPTLDCKSCSPARQLKETGNTTVILIEV